VECFGATADWQPDTTPSAEASDGTTLDEEDRRLNPHIVLPSLTRSSSEAPLAVASVNAQSQVRFDRLLKVATTAVCGPAGATRVSCWCRARSARKRTGRCSGALICPSWEVDPAIIASGETLKTEGRPCASPIPGKTLSQSPLEFWCGSRQVSSFPKSPTTLTSTASCSPGGSFMNA
jgi:hypothetical protein